MAVTTYFVSRIDSDLAYQKARARGMTDTDSLWDYIEPDEAECGQLCDSLHAAQIAAKAMRAADIFENPRIDVNEYPDARKRDWERTRVGYYELDGDEFTFYPYDDE